MSDVRVACRINGEEVTLEGPALGRLLDAVRAFGLTGAKEGCGEGECGACALIVNGDLVNSCLMPLRHAEGTDIVTIEGIGRPEQLHPLQEAFIACGAAQCGICTPGMLLASVTLLDRNTNPTDEEIASALAGNLCRCTGYMRIYEAVRQAADRIPRPLT